MIFASFGSKVLCNRLLFAHDDHFGNPSDVSNLLFSQPRTHILNLYYNLGNKNSRFKGSKNTFLSNENIINYIINEIIFQERMFLFNCVHA